MKKLFAATSLVLLCLINISGQETIFNQIIGSWYLMNNSLADSKDTLVFKRELDGNAFTIWDFKHNNTLIISSGSIRKNNPQAKCFSSVLHYKWEIEPAKKQDILKIVLGKDIEYYSITKLERGNFILIKLLL